MDAVLLIPLFASIAITAIFLPFWITRAQGAGLTGKDIHKNAQSSVAEAGGVVVLAGFVGGILSYIAIQTFFFDSFSITTPLFALLSTVLIAGVIGFTDDILGWKIGLTRRVRILLLLAAAIPLVVINAGEAAMMGIDLGLFYPLLFVPLGVVGATATFNFLAGYNGLEAGQGIILLGGLSYVLYHTGAHWLSFCALLMVFSLFVFHHYNSFPAAVFPGDSLTYSVGALIASLAILGNIEKIAVFFFLPYVLEVCLKLRGGLRKESFSTLNEDGSLSLRYGKVYGLEHAALLLLQKLNIVPTEQRIVWTLYLTQLLFVLLGIVFLL